MSGRRGTTTGGFAGINSFGNGLRNTNAQTTRFTADYVCFVLEECYEVSRMDKVELGSGFTAALAANRLVDACDCVVERKKDFVAVVKQPRADTVILRSD